ncbi:MAG: pyridoxal phosphate-dependent aminotransferase family protein [Clostridia bacterium]|nr:pyridoxal phosphate-dependent aminotransferase family protein [Clostridia bacterium]
MSIFDKCNEFNEPQKVKEMGIYPYFHALESGQDTEVVIDGRSTIMIGSNNYMGLTSDPRTIAAAKEALEKYGTGCSGSRFLNGTLDLHVALENELADFFKKDGAVTWSTGFQSNLGVISCLAGMHDYIISDRENHASIVDGCRLSYAKRTLKYNHSDMEDLERALSYVPEESGKLIVTDGVFSMGGDIANLPEICRLAKKYGAGVMVDDAHGVGMIGKDGSGTASYYGLEDEVDVIMTTFSKSLASLGGCIAANERIINYVRHKSRPFIFSASIPPANAASALAALRIIRAEPERRENLLKVAERMRYRLGQAGIPYGKSSTAIVPIMTYDMVRTLTITAKLLAEGVYVNPVLPPAVNPGECLLRTSYTATHTLEQIDRAADIIIKVYKEN